MFPPLREPEFTVPAGHTPAARCPHCDRPFQTEDFYALHLGEIHPERCTAAEAETYEEIYEAESFDLFTFHVKVIVTLTLLYFVMAYTYAVVWH